MFKTRLFVLSILLTISAFASEPQAPIKNEPLVGAGVPTQGLTTEGNIYECKPTHYHPPCRLIGTRPENSMDDDEESMAELLAAIRTARSRVTTPILQIGDTGPIEACGNGHGRSGCCRIVAVVDETLYIECG